MGASAMNEVSLGAIELEHSPAMYAWMLDDEVRANVGVRAIPTLERTREWIVRARKDEATEARAILVDGVYVGNVILDQIDRHASKARLSIYVGEASARGQGIGQRAVRLILGVAFRELNLAKVALTVHARNGRAIATYIACGFSVEGVHRGEFLLDGERIAELYMGILRSEFDRLSELRVIGENSGDGSD